MTLNCFWNELGLYFNTREEIKALFLKFACQSQLLGEVVSTVTYEHRIFVSDRNMSRYSSKY
jgi:quinolinate synthase